MRALAMVHQADAGPGVFAEQMNSAGVDLETWSLGAEPAAPRDLAAYDAALSFGGAMHADETERHGWIAHERAALAELLDRGTPLLGACLGAQLLCVAAGGEVRRLPDPEIGWYEIELTTAAESDPVLGRLPRSFSGFEWHSYECLPPPGSVLLARSEACVQAFRVGERAWGIQFHAEVSAADAEGWIADWRSDPDAVAIGLDADALRAETDAEIGRWNALGHELCGHFLAAVAAGA